LEGIEGENSKGEEFRRMERVRSEDQRKRERIGRNQRQIKEKIEEREVLNSDIFQQ